MNGQEINDGKESTLEEDRDATTPLNREATVEERVERLEKQMDQLLKDFNDLKWTVHPSSTT